MVSEYGPRSQTMFELHPRSLPNGKILDMIKFKAFADDNERQLKCG